MSSAGSAHGKIIVSGEYAVLFGKRGIAIPAKQKIDVTLSDSGKTGGITIRWKQSDVSISWQEYARKILNLAQTNKPDIRGTLTIDTSLPLGKGMGSSTALVIAMSKCLLGENCEDSAKRIEDIVNTGHSGLDFAVIWNGKPTVFIQGEAPVTATIKLPPMDEMELIDTGAPNETTQQLVAWIRGKQGNVQQAIDTIGQCTERLLRGEDIKAVIRDHHRAQVLLGVVPQATQDLIAGIEKKGGSAKVIGAGGRTGGGGMVLVLR